MEEFKGNATVRATRREVLLGARTSDIVFAKNVYTARTHSREHVVASEMQLTSFRAPKGELAQARAELGYATNQEMIMDLIRIACLKNRQKKAMNSILNTVDFGKLLDPDFIKEARR